MNVIKFFTSLLLLHVFQEFRGVEDGEDNARVKNRQVAKAAAQVLELESAGELCFALTTLRTETRGQQLKCFFYSRYSLVI